MYDVKLKRVLTFEKNPIGDTKMLYSHYMTFIRHTKLLEIIIFGQKKVGEKGCGIFFSHRFLKPLFSLLTTKLV